MGIYRILDLLLIEQTDGSAGLLMDIKGQYKCFLEFITAADLACGHTAGDNDPLVSRDDRQVWSDYIFLLFFFNNRHGDGH